MLTALKNIFHLYCYACGLGIAGLFVFGTYINQSETDPVQTAVAAPSQTTKAVPVRQAAATVPTPVRVPVPPAKSKDLGQSDLDKTVLHASALCKAVDKSGIATTPCEISGWNSSITVTMVADDTTANEFCDVATSFVRKGGYHFNDGWKLLVVSPYSNGTPIARCSL